MNTIGNSWKIRCCIGSPAGGFIAVVNHMVKPYSSGQTPMCRVVARMPPISGAWAGSQGIAPNRLKIVVGSRDERSWIQPKNGAWRISMVTVSTLYSE